MKYRYYSFGKYSWDKTPHTELSIVMNELASSGWECFSVTTETIGFFKKKTYYTLHCRRQI